MDYVGNCGRHKLVTSVDVLGVHHADDVVDLARGLVSEASARGESIDVQSALDRAVTLGQERRSRAMEEARLAQEREARCRDEAVAYRVTARASSGRRNVIKYSAPASFHVPM